jgi:poly-gamma-glutamate capsule biosynthesis protein CapA/YwtB (metallophosphatase superfamily)
MASQALDSSTVVTLFLCGDVMTGRGVDQLMSHPSSPEIFEPYMDSAGDYITLTVRAGGSAPGSNGWLTVTYVCAGAGGLHLGKTI